MIEKFSERGTPKKGFNPGRGVEVSDEEAIRFMRRDYVPQKKGVRVRRKSNLENVGGSTVELEYVSGEASQEYEATMRCYLAHSYTVSSYQDRLRALEADRRESRIPNLYAIVMPGGHGKTYLAKKYGFIDVDNMTGGSTAYTLGQMRLNYVRSNTREWGEHNMRWYGAIIDTMTMLTFERPTVILVHSEECAISIGASILGVLVLKEDEFEKNIARRSEEGIMFSRISRLFAIHRSLNPVMMCDSNQAIESKVVALCNWYHVPIPGPYAFSKSIKNCWYWEGTPNWLLIGDVGGREEYTDYVLWLEKKKRIPKECVDHFVAANCPSGKAFGFGVSMNEWATLAAQVMDKINEVKKFPLDGDMFEVFPPGSVAEKHRVNVTLRRLQEECDIFSDKMVKVILERHVGEKHVFVAGLVSHWLGIGSKLELGGHLLPLYFVGYEYWSDILGKFHNLIRLSNWYCTTPIKESERQGMMYMNMLTGRKMYTADWLKVVEERKKDETKNFVSYDPVRCLWTRAQYLEDFRAAMNCAYDRMYHNPKPVNVGSFVDFWKIRRNWVAKGSTVLNQLPPKMLKYTVSFLDHMMGEIELRHNKKSLFEQHEVMDLLRETTESWNATKAVPKLNETGKERQLLPGTLMHYVVFSYVLYVAECQDQVGTTRLNVKDEDGIIFYDRKMNSMYHMLYDWANFNAQHSVEDMARVIRMLEMIPTAPRDYGFFCRAIAESFYHMWLLDPEGGKHKLEKGLFSGWRGTTWINSVLNYVYVYVGIKCCERIYDDFCPTYIDHGGDDLDVGFRSAHDCFRMMKVMDAIGYEATAIKQMVDVKSEFFRNTITDEGVFASPTRALANFVSGNWESGGAKTLSEKTTSVLDQAAKLERRGVDGEFCKKLCAMSLKHWLKIKVEDEWFEVREEVVHGDVESGGLGIPDEKGCVWELSPTLKNQADLSLKVDLPGALCSKDYVSVLKEELAREQLRVTEEDALVEKLAKQSYDLKQYEERAIFNELNKADVKVVKKYPVIDNIWRWDSRLFEKFLVWIGTRNPGLDLGRLERYTELLGHLAYKDVVLDLEDLVSVYTRKRVSKVVAEFKGDVYHRRLVPDFMASAIDKFVRWEGNELGANDASMQEMFKTLTVMASRVYAHMA